MPKPNFIFCNICNKFMSNKRHILCVDCKSKICLLCFAKGAESETHFNNHDYKNVIVFSGNTWLSPQEQSDAKRYKKYSLSNKYGFSNWSGISRIIGCTCINNTYRHYIENNFGENHLYIRNEVPYIFKFDTHDPPRKVGSVHFVYDSSAEALISDLVTDWDCQYQDIGDKLNCALINTYNHRLRERIRRHRIVRHHGLITPNRMKSWIARFLKAFLPKNDSKNPSRADNFISLIQLTTGVAFDRIVEGLQYEYDLRKFLNKLYQLRVNGIQNYHCGRIFGKGKNIRISKATENCVSLWEWKYLMTKEAHSGCEQILSHCMEMKILPRKRNCAPLNIIGLSNYENLSKEERELCSLIRLIPESYLQAKKMLTFENGKLGYLRLADARRLIKIDVNKTRVMYDFFLNQGFINSK